jgi:septum formation inhibitor MinC
LVALNGLFIGYAVGLNSRHVLVVDPNLPRYVKPVAVPKVKIDKPTTTTTVKKTVVTKGATTSKGKPTASTVTPASKTAATNKTPATSKTTPTPKSTSTHQEKSVPKKPASAASTAHKSDKPVTKAVDQTKD